MQPRRDTRTVARDSIFCHLTSSCMAMVVESLTSGSATWKLPWRTGRVLVAGLRQRHRTPVASSWHGGTTFVFSRLIQNFLRASDRPDAEGSAAERSNARVRHRTASLNWLYY
jgi:hypothetical protein